jgi:hypothetical protein
MSIIPHFGEIVKEYFMTVHYLNIYENLPEALKRIRNTVVIYDDEPWFVLAVTAHKPDGIFRVYLEPVWHPDGSITHISGFPQTHKTSSDNPQIGDLLDKWMEANPDACEGRLLRKQMNSPLFRRFKPFPLGMCNSQGRVIHIERSPTRKTEQGLTYSMMSQTHLRLLQDNNHRMWNNVDLHSAEFYACIKGAYPTQEACFQALNDPEIANTGAAFHRQCALIRGPIGMLFLAYKNDIVGIFPHNDRTLLKLGDNFKHLKEVIEINCDFERIV